MPPQYRGEIDSGPSMAQPAAESVPHWQPARFKRQKFDENIALSPFSFTSLL
jgi:hypothetical protein